VNVNFSLPFKGREIVLVPALMNIKRFPKHGFLK
jgi:hypothetical protein